MAPDRRFLTTVFQSDKCIVNRPPKAKNASNSNLTLSTTIKMSKFSSKDFRTIQHNCSETGETTDEESKRDKGFMTKLWEGAKTTIGLNELPVSVKTTGRNRSKEIGISWNVQRKRTDFEWLSKMLIKFYPGTVVPPLPAIPRSEDKIFGYIKKLEAFLIDTYRCRELRNSKYFETFLSYSSRTDFDAFLKNAESIT